MNSRAERVALLYTLAERSTNGLLQTVRGAFDGLWLGILRRESLAAIDKRLYDREPKYKAADFNEGGLFMWEAALVKSVFPPGGRIVVTGAGGGREVLALLAGGFDAEGYEPHPALASVGARLTRAQGGRERVQRSERDEWPDVAGPVDGVIAGWSSYMLIPSRSMRLAYLRGARAALGKGGAILLSFYSRRGASLRSRVTVRVGNVVRAARRAEQLQLGDCMNLTYVHYFTKDEIAAELAEAGFLLEDFGTDGYGWAVGRVSA